MFWRRGLFDFGETRVLEGCGGNGFDYEKRTNAGVGMERTLSPPQNF